MKNNIRFTYSSNSNYFKIICAVLLGVVSSIALNILLQEKLDNNILQIASICGGFLTSGLIYILGRFVSCSSKCNNIPSMNVIYSNSGIKYISNCPIILNRNIRVKNLINSIAFEDCTLEKTPEQYVNISYKFDAIPCYKSNYGFIYKPEYFNITAKKNGKTFSYNVKHFEELYFVNPKLRFISSHVDFIKVALNSVLWDMSATDINNPIEQIETKKSTRGKKTSAE